MFNKSFFPKENWKTSKTNAISFYCRQWGFHEPGSNISHSIRWVEPKKKNETTISISFYVDAVEVDDDDDDDDDDDGGPKKRPILYQKKSKRKEKKIKIRPPPHFALMEAPRLHPKTKEKRPRIYL